MRKEFCHLLLFSFLLLLSFNASATHNRAGEITYEQITALKFRVTVTTYTKESSVTADRDSLELCWGDGSCQYIYRVVEEFGLPNDTKRNQYVAEHTYPGRFTYYISILDPNRNGGILNVNPPYSDLVPFYIETKLVILNAQFQGSNNSPVLLQPPIDVGYVGQPFIHNPNAFDVDGDSIAYQLVIPKQDVGVNATAYSFPEQVSPGPDNNVFFNEETGDFLWDAPQQAGEYNIAMTINEYRNGQLISCMVRDMQILILEGDNRPPEIDVEDEYCVIAGEKLRFEVIATDPDAGQKVQLSALGGPLSISFTPATFVVSPNFLNPPVVGVFEWNTSCEHIRGHHYQVIFKAQDDYNDTLGLTTLKTVRIKVVGPPPLDLQATALSGEVKLDWESPYSCEDAADDYFKGFSVWRKEGTNPFIVDDCTPGLAGRGYEQIAYFQKTIQNNRYVFSDTDVERGRYYCYRILGEFALTSTAGFPFNFVESLASDEICVQLSRDVPLITNVSILNTDPNAGEIEVRWTKPPFEDLDTIQNPGPYRYKLYHKAGFPGGAMQAVPGAEFISNTYWQANDTFFTIPNLDTETQPHSYEVAFFVNDTDSLGSTEPASSPFLTVASTDETNNLSWEAQTPWQNYEYIVYRSDIPPFNVFVPLDTVPVNSYSDQGLINGEKYCYYIQTIGSYGIPGVIDPILNLSQEACGIPLDTIPPCTPSIEVGAFTVDNGCATADNTTAEENFSFSVTWTNPNNYCEEDDTRSYNIYYASSPGADFVLIDSVIGAENISYTYFPGFTAAGCFAVTAVDSVWNESPLLVGEASCVDNCPLYELPNVFTPNQDGANDLYHPFSPYRFIERIEMKIFNRWGQLVFQTSDPDIMWDGKNLAGDDLAEGVYYYYALVTEKRLNGLLVRPEALEGYIHIIR